MSFQKLKTNKFCVGQKHYGGTKHINGDIVFNKKTGSVRLSFSWAMLDLQEKKSVIVSDNTIQAEG